MRIVEIPAAGIDYFAFDQHVEGLVFAELQPLFLIMVVNGGIAGLIRHVEVPPAGAQVGFFTGTGRREGVDRHRH